MISIVSENDDRKRSCGRSTPSTHAAWPARPLATAPSNVLVPHPIEALLNVRGGESHRDSPTASEPEGLAHRADDGPRAETSCESKATHALVMSAGVLRNRRARIRPTVQNNLSAD